MNLKRADRVAQLLMMLCLVLGLITSHVALYWIALVFAALDLVLAFVIDHQRKRRRQQSER